MQLKVILNQLQPQKGFIYSTTEFQKNPPTILVTIQPDKRANAICSGCEKPASGYDTLRTRRFEFVPLWGICVFFLYAMRRVDCGDCGVTVESIPWASGKCHLTKTYAWFLASWAKKMSWNEVARAFHTSWENVFRAVTKAVEWGLAHRDLTGITAIGIDEVLWQRPYKFLTVVYQIDAKCKRLLWVGKDRTIETTNAFFNFFGDERILKLKFICSDMWKPYLRVISEKAAHAIHVLDRFHIVAKMNKAIDEVRAEESKSLKEKGRGEVLKNSRWSLLKRPENLTRKQEVKLAELVRFNLKTVRAYLLKESFQQFWNYTSTGWAIAFLDRWCAQAMRSRIEPMKKVARTLDSHRLLILNWFRARGQVALGAVEGFNNRLKVVTRRAYGFRTFKAAEIALYHSLGNLPDPQDESTHRFC